MEITSKIPALQSSLETGDCYWRKWRLKPHCHIRDIEKGFQYMKASYPKVRDFFWVGINWINLTLCMTLAAPALIMIYVCFRCWKYMDLGEWISAENCWAFNWFGITRLNGQTWLIWCKSRGGKDFSTCILLFSYLKFGNFRTKDVFPKFCNCLTFVLCWCAQLWYVQLFFTW